MLKINPASPGDYLGSCSIVGCGDRYITGSNIYRYRIW